MRRPLCRPDHMAESGHCNMNHSTSTHSLGYGALYCCLYIAIVPETLETLHCPMCPYLFVTMKSFRCFKMILPSPPANTDSDKMQTRDH